MIVSLNLDDFSPINHNWGYLQDLKSHYPNLKITLFMAPFDKSSGSIQSIVNNQKFAKRLADNRDWIEIAVHGFTHVPKEMLTYDEKTIEGLLTATENLYVMFRRDKNININFVNGFCAPYWLRNESTDKVLKERGYWIAINDNVNPLGLSFYKYNWSIGDKFPEDMPIVRGHGHVQDVCDNGLIESFDNLLTIPDDAEFKFCSEVLQ
jgi:peptidoglycan/xylan/chitin deacetylase (PgdA/CDA1 family)